MNRDFVPPAYQLWRMSLAELDRIATRLFSMYIRTRDMDERGYVKCFTCHRKRHYTEIHCGHYAPRKNMCTKFLEINNNPQCEICNVTYDGNRTRYKRSLDRKFGTGTADYIDELSRKTCKYIKSDMIELIVSLEKALGYDTT